MGSWCIYEKDKLFLIWWGPHRAKKYRDYLTERKKIERVKYNVRKNILLNIRKKDAVEKTNLTHANLLPRHQFKGKMCLKFIFCN